MLRPLPDLSDEAYMLKLGKLSAIRSARMDALNEMKGCFIRLQSDMCNFEEEIKLMRECLDRLEALQTAA